MKILAFFQYQEVKDKGYTIGLIIYHAIALMMYKRFLCSTDMLAFPWYQVVKFCGEWCYGSIVRGVEEWSLADYAIIGDMSNADSTVVFLYVST
jgi:hypothetical protein